MAVKIALVGMGKIALEQHVPAISGSFNWDLAATVSNHSTVGGVENFASLEAMLQARPEIRVVSICTPPRPRFDCAAAALRAGRHVMLEKPPGATLSECLALKSMANDLGLSLFATWHSREAAHVGSARGWLADKPLRRLTVTWAEDVRRWHPKQRWIWEPGGLGVFDAGVNALSILTEILPEPIHVTAATLHIPANRDTPIAAELDFFHASGAEVTATFEWRRERDETWTIEAETDAGALLLSDGGARLAINGLEQTARAQRELPDGEYPRLYKKMADLLQRGAIDMDLAPMVLVADAFMLGRRVISGAFSD